MKNVYKLIWGGLFIGLWSLSGEAQAQTTGLKLGSNPGSKDPNAILDLSGTTTQGVLLPRIALTGTSNSAPLAGTVSSGMLVYNTATAGDVTPGVYFSNGTQWVRVASNGSGGMIQAPSLALTSTTDPTGTTGQVVYNTNAAAGVPVGLVVWNGSAWAPASGSTADGDAWGVTGEDQSSAIGRIGNVGIGTTTPTSKLDVNGVGTFSGGVQIGNGVNTGLFGDGVNVALRTYPGGATYFQSNGGAQTDMFISNTGNVGIGTVTPNAPLQFSNAGVNRKIVLWDASNNDHEYFGFGINTSILRYQTNNSSSDHVFYSGINSTSSAELMRIKGNGNVGIGTAVPSSKLHVEGTGTIAQFLTNGGAGSLAHILIGGGNPNWGEIRYTNVDNVGDARLSMGANGQENIVIDVSGANGGNVGIGTTNPTARLDVNGTSALRGLISTSDVIELNSLGSGDRFSFIDFHSQDGQDYNARIVREPGANGVFNIINGSSLLTLNTAGNVGIGTSSPSAKLEVAGNARIQTLPAGSGTDDVVTTDANGNLRKMPASTFTGATGPQGPAGPQGATGPAGSNATADGDAWGVTGEDQTSTIGRTGNVGIGTSSPAAKLHVQRSGIGTIARWDMSDGVVGSPTLMFETLSNTNGGAFKIQSVRSGLAEDAPLVLNPIGGNVGIGTTTPSSKLDVIGTIKGTHLENLGFDFFLGSGDQVLRGNSGLSRALVKTDNSVLTVNFAGDFTGGTQIGSFYSQASSGGNVGLGTTSPLHRLDSRGIIASGFGAGGEYQGLRVINDNVNFGSSAGIGMYVANFDKAIPGSNQAGTLMGGIRTEWRNDNDAAMSFYLSPTNSTVGDVKMTMMNNGNVGIGTTTPNSKLQVRNNGGINSFNLRLENSTNNGFLIFVDSLSSNAYNGISLTGDRGIIFSNDDDASSNENSGLVIAAHSNGTSGIKIMENGNVGIGTNTTNAPLQFSNSIINRKIVLWDASNNDNQYFGFGVNPNVFRYQTASQADDHVFYSGIDNASSSELMRIKGNGNVGIGTSNPTTRLHVAGGSLALGNTTTPGTWTSNGSDILLNTGGANSQIILRPNGDGSGVTQYVIQPVAGHMFFGSDAQEKVRITTTGNVGIGTTAPTSRLEVNGSATNSAANIVTGTTIDFGLSNLAATNNSGTAITLSNIKNGGAYTLALTSTSATGSVTFSSAGFTFVYVGTAARTSGKKHIYNFIVIGTEVYVTMGTEN